LPEKPKKVLLIAYYFPPMGLGGVQRALAIARYLSEIGWQVMVLTSDFHDYPILDRSLADKLPADVEVISVADPVSMGKQVKDENSYVLSRKNIFLRRFMRVPDSRLFWANNVYGKCLKKVRAFDPDWIVSTSPPPSVHLLARRLRSELKSGWLADFRDPWAGDNQPELTFLHGLLNRTMEAKTMKDADLVTAVTAEHSLDLKRRYQVYADKIHHIPNGYDPVDFCDIAECLPDEFVIAHGGTLVNYDYAGLFIDALVRLADESEEFKKRFRFHQIGSLTEPIHKLLKSDASSTIAVELTGYLGHRKTLRELGRASALVVFSGVAEGVELNMPGKLYEALYFDKPLLVMFRQSSPAIGVVAGLPEVYHLDPENKEQIRSQVKKLFEKHISGNLRIESRRAQISQYSRKAQTERMADLMGRLR
jgi:glycosyltransferase involved in cell wall biosynthesis